MIKRKMTIKIAAKRVMMCLQTANPNNVQGIIDDMQREGNKKIEAQKFLSHKGYSAKLQQSLMLTADEARRHVTRETLTVLQERKVEAFRFLRHQSVRNDNFGWLEKRAEGEFLEGQKEGEGRRKEAFVELCNLANRWMN